MMDELLEAAEEVLAVWYTPHDYTSLKSRMRELSQSLDLLRDEVELQRRRLALDEGGERVEQP